MMLPRSDCVVINFYTWNLGCYYHLIVHLLVMVDYGLNAHSMMFPNLCSSWQWVTYVYWFTLRTTFIVNFVSTLNTNLSFILGRHLCRKTTTMVIQVHTFILHCFKNISSAWCFVLCYKNKFYNVQSIKLCFLVHIL